MAGQNYSDAYIENVFYLWYNNNRQGGNNLTQSLTEEHGIKPSSTTINKWVKENGWIERADALDAEVSLALDKEVVDRRREMFKEHAEIGKEMREKGIKYLQSNALDDSQAAIRSIVSGIEIERTSVGLEQAYTKISKMTDAQITKELERLTGKVKEDEFVDADTEELGDDIDTESE